MAASAPTTAPAAARFWTRDDLLEYLDCFFDAETYESGETAGASGVLEQAFEMLRLNLRDHDGSLGSAVRDVSSALQILQELSELREGLAAAEGDAAAAELVRRFADVAQRAVELGYADFVRWFAPGAARPSP